MKVLYPGSVGGRARIARAKVSRAPISGAHPSKARARACGATGVAPVVMWQERRPFQSLLRVSVRRGARTIFRA